MTEEFNSMEKGQSFQQMVKEQLDMHMQKGKKKKETHTQHLLQTLTQMDHRPKCKMQN